jgi:lipoyl(octanoyl) transferase
VQVIRLEGLTPYAEALALQEQLVAEVADGIREATLLFVEHPPTITLGRRAGPDAVVDPSGVDVYAVSRGGEATWHAPGQRVVYPIVPLAASRRDLRAALAAIEDAVIDALAALGVSGHRDPRNTGVWLTGVDGVARKVCSVGIACRRWVLWHGLALNHDVDLSGFGRIHPCGFDAAVMTSLAAEGYAVVRTTLDRALEAALIARLGGLMLD